MKTLLFLLVILCMQVCLAADPGAETMRQNLAALELERNDYRKPNRELTPEKEEDRQKIIGWLITNDPVWAIQQEVIAQLTGLALIQTATEVRMDEIDWRKEVLAKLKDIKSLDTSSITEKQAGELRALIVLKDKSGLDSWFANIKQK